MAKSVSWPGAAMTRRARSMSSAVAARGRSSRRTPRSGRSVRALWTRPRTAAWSGSVAASRVSTHRFSMPVFSSASVSSAPSAPTTPAVASTSGRASSAGARRTAASGNGLSSPAARTIRGPVGAGGGSATATQRTAWKSGSSAVSSARSQKRLRWNAYVGSSALGPRGSRASQSRSTPSAKSRAAAVRTARTSSSPSRAGTHPSTNGASAALGPTSMTCAAANRAAPSANRTVRRTLSTQYPASDGSWPPATRTNSLTGSERSTCSTAAPKSSNTPSMWAEWNA